MPSLKRISRRRQTATTARLFLVGWIFHYRNQQDNSHGILMRCNNKAHVGNRKGADLSDLAALWRGRQNTPDAEMIVRQYQAILRCMIELGYHEELVVDSELPDQLMPQEYLDLFK
jgi:hypothetical protein